MVKDRKKEMADQTFQKWQLKDTVADTHLEGTGVPLSFPGGVLTSSGSEAPLRALECPQSTQLTLTQRNTLGAYIALLHSNPINVDRMCYSAGACLGK